LTGDRTVVAVFRTGYCHEWLQPALASCFPDHVLHFVTSEKLGKELDALAGSEDVPARRACWLGTRP
jgi:hypothetical protein